MITAPKIPNLAPDTKPYKVFDGNGLYILVTPKGGKLWRYKYRFGGRLKSLALGVYPEVSLAKAREKRNAARLQLDNGIDPGEIKKAQKALTLEAKTADAQAVETFELIAREWHAKFKSSWTPGHAATIVRRLEQNVFPWMGNVPIKEIKAPELLSVLRRIESRGLNETTRRIKIITGQIFRYGVATGRCEQDPSASLKGALAPAIPKHLSSITDPKLLGPLLRAIDGYQGSFVVKCALQLQALFFCRPGELRHAEWKEIDFDNALWSLPASKMKMRQAHIVPLSRQAVDILKSLQPLTGQGRFVFPSHRSAARPMSENAVNAALRRMGIEKTEMCGHGFRATARTILDEVLQQRPEIIEHQLAHKVKDPNGRAYNRTAHLEDRKAMMELWATYLDGLKQGAQVLPFRQKTA